MQLLDYTLHSDVEAFSTMRECGRFDVLDTPMGQPTQMDGQLPYPVICGHQVHGARVAIVDRPDMTRQELEGYDALITRLPDAAIGVRTADCVPILLYDPRHKVAAAIHSGWKGTVLHIVQATICLMHNRFGCEASDLLAQIGPSISPDSFQVGSEVVTQFEEAGFPLELIYTWQGEASDKPMSGGHHLDLWEANRWLLNQAGIPDSQIQIARIDTYTDTRWFSARREGIRCGRIIHAIRIKA